MCQEGGNRSLGHFLPVTHHISRLVNYLEEIFAIMASVSHIWNKSRTPKHRKYSQTNKICLYCEAWLVKAKPSNRVASLPSLSGKWVTTWRHAARCTSVVTAMFALPALLSDCVFVSSHIINTRWVANSYRTQTNTLEYSWHALHCVYLP